MELRPYFEDLIDSVFFDICRFTEHTGSITLRSYQRQVAYSIVDSILHNKGYSFVVMFPRQSGKNELQAQIEAYIMTLLSTKPGAEIVKVSPTWKPQTLNAMRRLQRVFEQNNVIKSWGWHKETGYIYRIGNARIYFFSGQPEANIVGATASTLLEVDEAQDVDINKFDKDISPMAASTNATRVFWGTAWTSRTLLARELRAAREAQDQDGIQRAFVLTADQVAEVVPAYGEYVSGQIHKLGRQNPMVRTQYFSEEIDAEGGMFPGWRIALMHGSHSAQTSPKPGQQTAILIDIGGEDEGYAGMEAIAEGLKNPGRDSTALTVIEIDKSTLEDELIRAPTYRVIYRQLWTGIKHTALYAQIRSLVETWGARHVVIDATGIGAGLASFLDRALPGVVVPFIFNAASKSKLGWDFLSIIDTGRFKDSRQDDPLAALFFEQLAAMQYEIMTGPDRKMKWSVPDGTRSPAGELIHDDLVLSAALVAVLEEQSLIPSGPTLLVPAADPLEDMSHGY